MIKPSRVIARRISGARRVVRRLALALMAALLAAQAVGPATLPAVAGELGYSGSVVGAAPVAYWKLDDSSGQSLAANAVNPPQNTGVMKGYSMGFDGGAGYVATNLDVQPSAMPTTTWEAWIMPQPNNGFDQAILCNDDGGWDRCVNILGSSGNFLVFTGSGTLWFPVAATFGQWQHIAVVYSQNNVLF
ncbi:MAG: hypothetical protein NTZ05_03135, partial [Chloroflexi bacterium]|nr:hypothetical protein [Chloroflexota bacterium]